MGHGEVAIGKWRNFTIEVGLFRCYQLKTIIKHLIRSFQKSQHITTYSLQWCWGHGWHINHFSFPLLSLTERQHRWPNGIVAGGLHGKQQHKECADGRESFDGELTASLFHKVGSPSNTWGLDSDVVFVTWFLQSTETKSPVKICWNQIGSQVQSRILAHI